MIKSLSTIRKYSLFIAMVLVALLPRVWLLSKSLSLGLSVDELQSAVHATLSLPSLVRSVRVFDPHPPLFYLQLHYWIELAGSTNDLWLMTNSLFWNLATAISLYFIGNRSFGAPVGVIAVIFFSLSPISIAYSNIVRMYSMLMFLAIWHFHFSQLYFSNHSKVIYGIGAFITGLGFIYSHGAGFLILGSNVTLAALHYWSDEKPDHYLALKYAVLPLALLVCSVPWFVRANSASVSHTRAPTMVDVQHTFSQLLFGTKIVLLESNVLFGFAFLMMIIIIGALAIYYKTRVLALSFLILPLLSSLLISHFIKPIWVTWTLVYIVPLLCLGISIWLWELVRSPNLRSSPLYLVQLLVIGLLVFGSLFGVFYQQYNYLPWSHVKEASQLVAEIADPSDIVIVPNERVFWGWAWYFVDPLSINPLNTSYHVVSMDGVQVISNPAINQPDLFKEDQILWVVYRSGERVKWSSELPEIVQRERVQAFRDVVIEKWEVDNS